MTSNPLARPSRLDLVSFSSAAAMHPEFVRRLVVLGLLAGTAAVAVQVYVGGVKDAEGSSGWANDQQHATFLGYAARIDRPRLRRIMPA